MVNVLKSGIFIMSMWLLCGHPTTIEFPLVSNNEYAAIVNYQAVEIELYCRSEDYENIILRIVVNVDSLITFYPNNVKISHDNEMINYRYRINNRKSNKTMIPIEKGQKYFDYKSDSLKLNRNENIIVYADSILSIGDQYYNIDTLTFSVANGKPLPYR